MKKIFTLIAMALMTVGAQAQTETTTIFDANDSGWSAEGVNLESTAGITVGSVTWYGRTNAALEVDENRGFSDGKIWNKSLKTGGGSQFQSGKDLNAVLTFTPTIDGVVKIYCRANGTNRFIALSQTEPTTTNRDKTTAIATLEIGEEVPYSIFQVKVEANKKCYVWCDNAFKIYGITVGPEPKAAWDEDVVTPSEALDLTDGTKASSQLSVEWSSDKPKVDTDGTDNYVVFSAYSAYQTYNDGKVNWTAVPANGEGKGGSTDLAAGNWVAPSGSVFLGGANYTQYTKNAGKENEFTAARFATNNPTRTFTKYSYRVKGVSKIQFLANTAGSNRNIQFAAFEVTDGTPAANTTVFADYGTNSVGVATLDVDKTKEYVVTAKRTDTTSSNGRIYEVAFFYDKDVNVQISTGIQTINTATETSNGAIYNLAGQQVSETYKGVVIKNGKKYVQK